MAFPDAKDRDSRLMDSLITENLKDKSVLALLRAHSAVLDELRRRKICRTNNNPVGDYTEWLVCRSLNLTPQGNSASGFDAEGNDGVKYQIKGRRSDAQRVQFSAIRNLNGKQFDFLVAVAFLDDWSIRVALKLSHDAVSRVVQFQGHTNSHRLLLSGMEAGQEGVEDIRSLLGEAAA